MKQFLNLIRKKRNIISLGYCLLLTIIIINLFLKNKTLDQIIYLGQISESSKYALIVTIIAVSILSLYLINIIPKIAKYVDDGNKTQSNNNSFKSQFNSLEAKLKDHIKQLIVEQLDDLSTDSINEKERLLSHLEDNILDYEHELFSDDDRKLILIEEHTNNIQLSITEQIERITKLGNVNLLIGLVLTVLAIVLLIIIVFSPSSTIDFVNSRSTVWDKFLIHMTPRLSIVLFIEFFSFFFLNLYKRNNDEIKYFNNERTNIESKIIALKMAVIFGDKPSINKTIVSLHETDRNSSLKRGESTIELEKLKIDKSAFDNTIENISKLGKIFSNK